MDGSGYLWGGLALFGLFAMATKPDPVPLPDPNGRSERVEVIEPLAAGRGIASLEIKRAADSHFYIEALVNGTPVRFVVDRSAAKVVLTAADARRAGIGGGGLVTIERLSMGALSAEQVPAIVASERVSVLGQSYLSRINKVALEGDTMILR